MGEKSLKEMDFLMIWTKLCTVSDTQSHHYKTKATHTLLCQTPHPLALQHNFYVLIHIRLYYTLQSTITILL